MIRNKINITSFVVLLIIPMFEIVQLLIYQSNSEEVFHPAFAFFLSSSSIGHAPQILLMWFLPIYLLLMGADDAIQDYKTGYRNILISKVGRKTYFKEKILTSFIISSLTMFISLFVNFVLVSIIFANGTFSKSLMEMESSGNHLFSFSIAHPYIAIFLFTIISSFLAGLAGTLGASTSLFFLDMKYAYAAAFFIWFLLVLNKQSLVYLFQPFTEYGFDVLLPIFILVTSVVITITIAVFVYEVKYNED
ncbi:DUF2705 family protein [Paraliobacillus sp. JSM ZJ581]|uniref:DUF2705 family protein n=1 Tax=Paraliobacillus sp. JSM ZJ581 TaxID=3342118 RepID=UPI0035A92BA3